MCEFCKREIKEQPASLMSKSNSLGILGELRTNLELSSYHDEYFIGAYSDFDANDDSFGGWIKINYCPMCGRDLRKELK